MSNSEDLKFDIRVTCDGAHTPKARCKEGRWILKSAGMQNDPLKGNTVKLEFWSPSMAMEALSGDMQYIRPGMGGGGVYSNQFFTKLHAEGPPETDWEKGKRYEPGEYVRLKHPHKWRWCVYLRVRAEESEFLYRPEKEPDSQEGLSFWVRVAEIRTPSDVPENL